MRLPVLLAGALCLLSAADWPRFRGPNGAGVADGSPPVEFGPARNVGWKVAPPTGKSSPVIVGGKLFLTGHDGDRLLTVAYDAATGRELWRREVKRRNTQKRHKLNDAAAPTVAADSQRVVVFFTEFGLASYSLDGKPEWTLPLEAMASMQGVSASPLLHGDAVYLVVDQARDSYVLAVNAANGERRWRTPRPDAVGGVYSSPVLFTAGPEPVLGVLGDIEFSAYSLKTGERVWWVSGLPSQAKTSPAVAGDRIVLSVNAMAEESQIPVFAALNGGKALALAEAKGVPRAVFPTVDRNRDEQIDEAEWTEFRAQALQPSATLSIHPTGRGDLTKTAVEWRATRAVPNVPSPLVANGRVYTVRNGGVAGIYDATTGAVKKEFRLPGALGDYYASPVAAGKHVYFASVEGKMTVLAGEEVVHSVALEEEIFATPAIVGDSLYVRTQASLYCFRRPPSVALRQGLETVEAALDGGSIPLEPLGQEWAGVAVVQFRFFSVDGKAIETASERIEIRVDEERRRELAARRMKVTRRMPAGAAAVRATVVALPSGKELGEVEIALTPPPPTFQVEAGLALVPFRVEGKAKGMMGALTADDIVLTEDKQPRPATVFAAGQRGVALAPVEITLLFDCSGSVQLLGALDTEVFRRGLLEEFPNVRIAVFGFSDDLVEFTGHTRDEALLEQAAKAVALVQPRATPLFGSIQSVIHRFDLTRPALRLLVVFSDGESTTPGDQGAIGSVVQAAQRAGVAIYPVQLSAIPPASQAPRPRPTARNGSVRAQTLASEALDARVSVAAFQRLEQTGGKGFVKVPNASVLPSVLQTIAGTLRETYVAGYTPQAGEAPRERRVRVTLRDASAGKVISGTRLVVR